ncbi:MAG: hypothetical protein JXB38_05025 [Anaerolineales bacterium]|nr:hypothetical protein [Anaerolineales bacterium]
MAQKKKKGPAPRTKEPKARRSWQQIIFIAFAILMVFLMIVGTFAYAF